MALNSYGVEMTPAILDQGQDALDKVKAAKEAWAAFELAATGGEFAGTNTSDYLNDAEEEVQADVTRLTDTGV